MNLPTKSSKAIQTIINSVLMPMVVVDYKADLLYINIPFISQTGFSYEELKGKNIFKELFHEQLNFDLNAEFASFQQNESDDKTLFKIPSILIDKGKQQHAVNVFISELILDEQIYFLFHLNEINLTKKEQQVILEKEKMFQALSKASTEILDLPDLKSIYQYICQNLQVLFPHSVVLFVQVNEEDKETSLIEIAGLSDKLLLRIRQITGFELIGSKFKLVPEIIRRFKSGNFTEFEGGLAEFSMNQFPAFAANTMQKIIGIHKIYTIGINKDNELLGAIHFFTRNKTYISDGRFIELFVKQAGNVIQNRIMNELLLQSEKRFRSIFEEAPMGIALIDSLNGQIYEVNQKFAEIAGWSMKEIVKTDWMDFTHPDDVQADLDNMLRLNVGEISAFNMDKRYIRKDGSFVWVNMTVTPASVKDISKPCHLSIIEDITEKKNHIEEIQRERILLRTLIDNIPDTIYVKDLNARKILANLADVEVAGHQKEADITGKTDLEIYSEVDGTNGYNQDMQIIQTGLPILNDESYFFDIKGEKQWIQTTKVPLRNEKGEITGLIGIGKNITERKAAEKALAENYQYIKSLIESIPMGMDVVDCEGNILFQNDIFKNMLGYDARGKKCWKTYRDIQQPCTACPLKTGIELGVTKTYEEEGILGGKIFEISHTGILFEGQLAMLEIFHDITPIRESENKLKQFAIELQSSNAAKDKLFSIISHDLRNPFSSILGFSSLLHENISSFKQEELEEIIEALHVESTTAFTLLNNLLNWSRTQLKKIEAKPYNFILNEVILACLKSVSELSKQKNIQLKVDLTEKFYVFADDTMVETILRNLLTNAIKFTPSEGEITIKVIKKEELIEIAVQDNGIGMSPKILDQLFGSDSYTSSPGTNDEKGTGLGLNVCKEFIEMNNGEIWAESTVNVGSTFHFTLPLK
ncbi:MAG: PAS domain S-box protein [Prolixibacteraceae bacterium]